MEAVGSASPYGFTPFPKLGDSLGWGDLARFSLSARSFKAVLLVFLGCAGGIIGGGIFWVFLSLTCAALYKRVGTLKEGWDSGASGYNLKNNKNCFRDLGETVNG